MAQVQSLAWEFPHATWLNNEEINTFLVFFLFTTTPAAYGSSRASGLIRAIPVGLCHGRGNPGSEKHLQPKPQLAAIPDCWEKKKN